MVSKQMHHVQDMMCHFDYVRITEAAANSVNFIMVLQDVQVPTPLAHLMSQ